MRRSIGWMAAVCVGSAVAVIACGGGAIPHRADAGVRAERAHGQDRCGPERCNPKAHERPFIIEWDATDMSHVRVPRGDRRDLRPLRGLRSEGARPCANDSIRGAFGPTTRGLDERLGREDGHRERGRALREAAARRRDPRRSRVGRREVPHGVLRQRRANRDAARRLSRRAREGARLQGRDALRLRLRAGRVRARVGEEGERRGAGRVPGDGRRREARDLAERGQEGRHARELSRRDREGSAHVPGSDPSDVA